MLKYLAQATGIRPPPAHAVISKTNTNTALQEHANTLLNAFGPDRRGAVRAVRPRNAKTLRNQDSSRFGKYIKTGCVRVRTRPEAGVPQQGQRHNRCDRVARTRGIRASTQIKDYLLERTRCIMHTEDDQLYHIFYYRDYALQKSRNGPQTWLFRHPKPTKPQKMSVSLH